MSKPPAKAKSTRAKKPKNPAPYRPWIDNYPKGVVWDAELDDTPVFERVRAAVDKYSDMKALDFMGASTSFAEMWRTVEAMCGAFQQQLGVKKGTRVALLLPNTPYYVYAYYAVQMAGGIVVNCNPLYTVKELDHIITNARAEILITLDLKQLFDKAEALCKQTDVKKLVVCPFAKVLPPVKSVLFRLVKRKDIANVSGSSVADRIVYYDHLIRSGAKPSPVEIDTKKDVAVQQYTGGTTGIPKGAMLSHANISVQVSQIGLWGEDAYRPGTSLVAVLPFFHIFSMTTCMNAALIFGVEIVMLPRFEMKAMLDLIKRKRPEMLLAVPTLTRALVSGEAAADRDLTSFELCVSGGSALPVETIKAWKERTGGVIAEGYGLTECSPVVSCSPYDDTRKDGSIGLPWPRTDVRFVSLEDPTKEVPHGERGELVVKGPQVMLGYFDNDEANKAAFSDGWLRTGDVGYIDEDGHMFLVDRIKDLIICSGFNVYPRNIEEAIYLHPAVDECNVIGVEDAHRGEAPVAFIKLKEGESLNGAEIKKFLADHISKIEIPRDVVFKDELPKTLVGKLSKNELREEYAQMKEDK